MATVSESFAGLYRARREMSEPTDLARLFIARLLYTSDTRVPAALTALVNNLKSGKLTGLAGPKMGEYTGWLQGFLTLGQRTRGTSFYPIHPSLSRLTNGEEARADGFIQTLVQAFSPDDRQKINGLWQQLPPFEKAIYDLLNWQIPAAEPMAPSTLAYVEPAADPGLTPAAAKIIDQTRQDLLALGEVSDGLQNYIDHAGRLLALALARFLLAQAEVDMTLPIYLAPAADSHEGVQTLAHQAIELHRKHFEQSLHQQFERFYREAVTVEKSQPDPPSATVARDLTKRIFHANANIVPLDQYQNLRQEHGTLCAISYHYYWQSSGAASRFLRQLHAAQLNLVKKAGIANSRSRYSTWHYYWLAPALVETLLMVSRPRLKRDRMLVVELLQDWRDRYGLALLIDSTWEDIYRANFRGLGNPESLNEANQRRFNEILAERGRLHKNSDDFPWVILRD